MRDVMLITTGWWGLVGYGMDAVGVCDQQVTSAVVSIPNGHERISLFCPPLSRCSPCPFWSCCPHLSGCSPKPERPEGSILMGLGCCSYEVWRESAVVEESGTVGGGERFGGVAGVAGRRGGTHSDATGKTSHKTVEKGIPARPQRAFMCVTRWYVQESSVFDMCEQIDTREWGRSLYHNTVVCTGASTPGV